MSDFKLPEQSIWVDKATKKLEINIWPKQQQFLSSNIDELFFGGAAGGGKSEALLMFMLRRRMEHPKTQGIAFRRKFPDLDKSLILRSKSIFPLVGAKYNSSNHVWTFPNGSTQRFSFCKSDGDVYDHQGAEYADICFDELTHFTQFQFAYLTSRVRSADAKVKALVRSASNPGNVGHTWVKKRYVDPSVSQKIWFLEDEEKWVSFIPSLLDDNPSLQLADPGYGNRLKILGEKKFKALRYGDWSVFEGQYFDEWDSRPGMSVLRKDRVPDSHTIKFLSMDWGFASPACILWWEVTPSGRVFIYRELYTTRRSPKELAKDILLLSPKDEIYDCLWAPPEIWGKEIETEGGGEPIAKLMESVLSSRMPMRKANNARVPGWMKCREYMGVAPDGYPWLQISPSCQNLVRTLPEQLHDELKPEDLDTDAEDHAPDAMRYGAVSLKEVPKVMMTPQGVVQGFEKMFGDRGSNQKNISYIPGWSGRGGYG